jgi:hypothetical protein
MKHLTSRHGQYQRSHWIDAVATRSPPEPWPVVGALGEESVRRLLAGSLESRGELGATRMHGEIEFHGPDGVQHGPDAAIDVWPDVVLIEVTQAVRRGLRPRPATPLPCARCSTRPSSRSSSLAPTTSYRRVRYPDTVAAPQHMCPLLLAITPRPTAGQRDTNERGSAPGRSPARGAKNATKGSSDGGTTRDPDTRPAGSRDRVSGAVMTSLV